ncbi:MULTISPECIES: hypothetical protein [unclassified Microbacterium]|uniref:hypothetical protein n=1 Tax=unclassified Microbacterium TaxID=2609290 RepID=UPI00214B693B|nr:MULTISPECIES: hypothetical protein [unclassified Microbacterium]MCR2808691.1 hypothetical protein [Microbacterium sp. zg.B185]WIM18877.1 hypothetical protein QNO12_15025 [Microbacterium sp. zg-B185]
MIVRISVAPPREANLPRDAAADALKQLPARRPADPPAPSSPLQWALISPDCYEVTSSDVTVGFIRVVGAVCVALAGPRYDLAVEVAQTLVFDAAVDALGETTA